MKSRFSVNLLLYGNTLTSNLMNLENQLRSFNQNVLGGLTITLTIAIWLLFPA
jgi:hypothetical protein